MDNGKRILKQKRPHSTGEILINPSIMNNTIFRLFSTSFCFTGKIIKQKASASKGQFNKLEMYQTIFQISLTLRLIKSLICN